jgi:hypothetical protein
MIALILLVAGTGCQSQTPDPQGGTMTTRNAQMPDLPNDEDAAKAIVRKMLMVEAGVLLKASSLKYTAAQFEVPFSDSSKTQKGDLLIQFQPCSEEQVKAMTDAIWAHGWKKGSISHAVNVRKGPLYLQWGRGFDGCIFEMTTMDVSQHMRITDDITRVPELAAFKTTG